MKLVILAGGLGTRLMEHTNTVPKPMVEIGGRPMLYHIMMYYSFYGINDFIICTGYKSSVINEYFASLYQFSKELNIDFKSQKIDFSYPDTFMKNWKVKIVNTGANSMTGGRIKRIEKFIEDDSFLLTYGDCLSNVNIKTLIKKFNSKKNADVLLTSVKIPARFGHIISKNNIVTKFEEKPKKYLNSMINGGFFVVNKKVLRLINDDSCVWENDVLTKLSSKGTLYCHEHSGFWKPMDTLKDRMDLEKLWEANSAPWKKW